jgi:hypothetical protein
MIGGIPERNLPATDRAVEFSGNPTFHYWENSLIAIAVGQERITYETLQQYGLPSWWFLFRKQPGRQGIAKNKTSTRKVRLLTRFFTFKKERCGSPLARNTNHQQLPRFWA